MFAAERLRVAIEELVFKPGPGLHHNLTISIGIASSSRQDLTAEQLLHAADSALYRAKNAGRNQTALAPPV
jgi:diguanylate cyclase (GGDEF)-like protein